MADLSPPVFYDCEASSLDGFVIEICRAYVRRRSDNLCLVIDASGS